MRLMMTQAKEHTSDDKNQACISDPRPIVRCIVRSNSSVHTIRSRSCDASDSVDGVEEGQTQIKQYTKKTYWYK